MMTFREKIGEQIYDSLLARSETSKPSMYGVKCLEMSKEDLIVAIMIESMTGGKDDPSEQIRKNIETVRA
jgi:hypothetical protein